MFCRTGPPVKMFLQYSWKTKDHYLVAGMCTHNRPEVVGAGTAEPCGGKEVCAIYDISQTVIVDVLPATTGTSARRRIHGSGADVLRERGNRSQRKGTAVENRKFRRRR